MKQIKLFAFFLVSMMAAQSALAANEWVLVKKQQGPQSWDCSQNLSIEKEGTQMTLAFSSPQSSDIYYNVNQGVVCAKSSSGDSMLGPRQRCYFNEAAESATSWQLTKKSCTGNIFGGKCNPKKEKNSDSSVVINKQNKTLTYSMITGWQEAPLFVCVYQSR